MTNLDIYLNCFRFFIYIALIWVGYFWLYRNFALDSFRQKMFALRDQLFDDASDGVISFEHPAYGILRGTMNGFIRFGHRLSFSDMLFSFIMTPKDDFNKLQQYSFDEKYEFFTRKLDIKTKERLDYYRYQMIFLVILYMFKTSIFLLILTSVFIIPIIILRLVQKSIIEAFKSVFRKPLENIEATAMALGRVS